MKKETEKRVFKKIKEGLDGRVFSQENMTERLNDLIMKDLRGYSVRVTVNNLPDVGGPVIVCAGADVGDNEPVQSFETIVFGDLSYRLDLFEADCDEIHRASVELFYNADGSYRKSVKINGWYFDRDFTNESGRTYYCIAHDGYIRVLADDIFVSRGEEDEIQVDNVDQIIDFFGIPR